MVVARVPPHQHKGHTGYSVTHGAEAALTALLAVCRSELPPTCTHRIHRVRFDAPIGDDVYFPCPLKEQEAAASIKALEGLVAAAIADFRLGVPVERLVQVDMARTACFLMSAYVCTIDGMGKNHAQVKTKIMDTDLNQAQSVPYRRLAANLYETKNPGEYYHIHGSLEATKTLHMIGLPPFNPGLSSYKDCIQTIEAAVKRFSVSELEELNQREGQAGVPVLKAEQFRQTSHGEALMSLPPFTVQSLESTTPPVPFKPRERQNHCPSQAPSRCLDGIRVVELCRVIAGPTIGRSLAAHGAQVIKVTSDHLPDVPFFQVDVNTGKHTTSLHLRDASNRAVFESLLATADVVLDGYRPGVLDRLGYGPENLTQLAKARDRGVVYVAEDCFGGTGTRAAARAEWASRPGWQQIADCVTGVAWEQGRFMGLDEPVVPPFPMSDYGTGALGCVAAMTGLYRRATQGGSWVCRTSLCQYDLFLISLGRLPSDVQARLRRVHDPAFFGLRHHDSVDEVGKQALDSMRRVYPTLFSEVMMQRAWSEGYGAEVMWPREPLRVEGLGVGHVMATRPNGFDAPSWEGWKEQRDIIAANWP